jgi:hypothetical protein
MLDARNAVGAALAVIFGRPFVPLAKEAGKPKSRVLTELLRAKEESDKKNYRAKHDILRRLIRSDPDAFHIDSEAGSIVGLTHRSGFRIHTRRDTLPAVLRRLPT